MHRSYLFASIVLVALLFSFAAQGQYSLKGKVTTEDTHEALPFAYVFLSSTSYGTQTDVEGNFELTSIPAGTYKLVVSFIGYESIVVEVHPEEPKIYNFILKPSLNRLKEVVVQGKGPNASMRVQNMKAFRENFIGLSENAKECTIENPNVLDFRNEALVLEATADSLLIIQNDGLGYKLKFLLEKFKLNTLSHNVLYKGQVLFEKLPAKDEHEEQLRANNRLKAYYGSEMHFMRSLYQLCLAEEGFFISLIQDKKLKNGRIIPYSKTDTALLVRSRLFNKWMNLPTLSRYYSILDSVKSTPTHPVLKFRGKLEILYVHEAESLSYLRLRDSGNRGYTLPQRTRLELLKPGVSIESNGTIISQENLPSQGYWSWELVAETLPIDYDPKEDQKIVAQATRHQ